MNRNQNMNPMIPVIDAKRFSWSGNVGVAEASDFKGLNIPTRIWWDAADVGFNVKSTKTGAIKLFTMVDIDEDVMLFKDDSGQFTIRIYND